MTYLRRKIQVLPVYEMLYQLLIGSKADRAGNLCRKSDSTFLFYFFEARFITEVHSLKRMKPI